MNDQSETAKIVEPNNVSSKPKILTALGHSCALAAFLGIFISASAYSTDPNSGMVRFGIILTVAGVIGFILARWIGKNRGR